MKNKLILVILLCLLLFIPLVSAETVNGTLGGGSLQSYNYHRDYMANDNTGSSYARLRTTTLQSTIGLKAIIVYDNAGFGNATISGGQAPFNATVSGTLVGYGTIGYQRIFDISGNQISCYVWYVFDYWNPASFTGDQQVDFIYNETTLGTTIGGGSSWAGAPIGNPIVPTSSWYMLTTHGYPNMGYWTVNYDESFYNDYTAFYPSTLGIAGSVSKRNGAYPSKAYIINATSGAAITSNNLVTPANLTFNIVYQPIKVAVLSASGTWYNSSTLFGTPIGTPTPTPTPVVSPYTIELSADYRNYNEPITGTLLYNGVAATAANTRAVDWIYRDASLVQDTDGEYTNNINYVETGNTTKHLNYGWNGTKFVGWDTSTQAFSNDKGASLPNALSLYTLLSGSVTVQCMVYPVGGGAPSIVTHPLTVGGTGSNYNLVIHAVDWQTGSIIGGSTISIKEKLTNTWSNVTTDDSGYRRVTYPMGTPLYIYASATGYVPDFLNYQVLGNDFINIQLYRSGTEETNASLSTLLVRTFERNDIGQIQPLSGVTVSLSDGQVKTSTAGAAQFTVANNTAVSIDAFKTGYISATKTVTPNSALTTATLYLYSTSSTFVPTPFPTATPTIRPTQTIQGNLTTCQAVLPAGADVMDIMKNNIACWGIDDLEGQNFTMAALIILICAMVLGKFGKGDGAAIGAIIGFVISYARHLIPFYILIIAIALIAAYFAQKFFGSK